MADENSVARKVVWVGDFTGSSVGESAGFAMDCGHQGFGNATIFKVDGEFVDMEMDDPSANRAAYEGILILMPDQLAKVLNEWQRRYVDEPERFENEMQMLKGFLADETAGVEPSYGVEGGAYMMSIAKDLGYL